jgi:hypothetical protein
MWYQSLNFWKAISFLVAGASLLLYQYGVIPVTYVYDAGVILSAILAVLHWLHIDPSLYGLKD